MVTLISFFPLFLVLLVFIYLAAELTSPLDRFGSGTYAYQVEGERPLKMEELQAFGPPFLMPVRFVLVHQNKLVSASVDGLICIFDTRGSVNHNGHLEPSLRDVLYSASPIQPCASSGASSEALYTPQVRNDLTPKIDQMFGSLKDAHNFYNNYAREAGFGVRIHSSKLGKGGVTIRKEFLLYVEVLQIQ